MGSAALGACHFQATGVGLGFCHDRARRPVGSSFRPMGARCGWPSVRSRPGGALRNLAPTSKWPTAAATRLRGEPSNA